MLASNPESIAQVLGACKPHLGSESLPFEPRLQLVEGLARLVGQVRLVDVARQALKQLIAVLTRARAAAAAVAAERRAG